MNTNINITNMNKLIILIMLFICGTAYSQYSIPLRLVNSSGEPLTGQASNIVFTRYPHSYGTDDVSGITVTEIGTAGNYRCRGFTTYEYVKLWLSGVEQTWFDSVQVGNLTTYITTNYILKAGSVTGITGNKTISSGDWLKLGGTETWYKPYVYSSSPWYTDYSLLSGGSLVFKNYGDSVYGIKPYFLDGTNIRLNTGYNLLGRTNTDPPINVNTGHFSYTDDELSLNPYLFRWDSVSVVEDTTVSESNYSKIWSLHRNHFSEIDSMRLWITYFNTLANTKDSFQLINDVIYNLDERYARTLDSISVAAIDTFTYPQVGLWKTDVLIDYEFEYVTPNNSGYDSIFCAIYAGDISEDEKLDYTTNKVAFNSGVPFGNRSSITFAFHRMVTPGNLSGLYIIGGLTSGICHAASGSAKVYIRRVKVQATKIR